MIENKKQIEELIGRDLLNCKVIKVFEHIHQKYTVEFRCHCGKFFKYTVGSLIRKFKNKNVPSFSCGCKKDRNPARSKLIKQGDIVGNLTVIENTDKLSKVKCRCICGKEIVRNKKSLHRSKFQKYQASCGCMDYLRKKDRRSVTYKHYYREFVNQNKRGRKLEMSISFEEWLSIVTKPCTYCNDFQIRNFHKRLENSHRKSTPPKRTTRSLRLGKNLTEKDIKEFDSNCCGIDRMDSNKGYTLENSVPCCIKCNVAKSSYSFDQFKEHVKKMYIHLFKDEDFS